MHYVGIDIVEIARIGQAVEQWQGRFLKRIYTEKELEICRNDIPSLAAHFAAKEAVMKALGTGIRGVGWKEIEVLSNPSGKPIVYLHGKAQSKAQELGINGLDISLSHSKEYAIAAVIGEKDERKD